MDASILTAILGFSGTLLGTFAGIITSTKLSNYRIEQLEKKVEKHNSVVERTFRLEEDFRNIQEEISDIREDIRSHHIS